MKKEVVVMGILVILLFSSFAVGLGSGDTNVSSVVNLKQTNDVVVGDNYIKNSKLYIAWDTTVAYYSNNNPKGVITVWKVDDNGNGDPTDDLNRIRGDLTGGEIGLQVLIGKYGVWGKWQRLLGDKYPAEINTYKSGGNGVVDIKCNYTEYNFELDLRYTIKPHDQNLYANVSYKVYGPTDINFVRYSYSQICSIWVTSDLGEMAWFDYYKISGEPEHAISDLPKADNKIHVTKYPIYGALRASSKNWITGLVPLNTSKIQDYYLRIKTGGSYNGWPFRRDIDCVIYNKTTSIPQGTEENVSFIWYAANTSSYNGIENLAREMQRETPPTTSHQNTSPNGPDNSWLWIVLGAVIAAVVLIVLILMKKKSTKSQPQSYYGYPPQYPQQPPQQVQQPPPQQTQPPQYQQTGYPPPPPPSSQGGFVNKTQTPSQSMGMITVTCPVCGFTSQMPESMRGQLVQCPKCGNQFQVP